VRPHSQQEPVDSVRQLGLFTCSEGGGALVTVAVGGQAREALRTTRGARHGAEGWAPYLKWMWRGSQTMVPSLPTNW
jgi:hypothetical protein